MARTRADHRSNSSKLNLLYTLANFERVKLPQRMDEVAAASKIVRFGNTINGPQLGGHRDV